MAFAAAPALFFACARLRAVAHHGPSEAVRHPISVTATSTQRGEQRTRDKTLPRLPRWLAAQCGDSDRAELAPPVA